MFILFIFFFILTNQYLQNCYHIIQRIKFTVELFSEDKKTDDGCYDKAKYRRILWAISAATFEPPHDKTNKMTVRPAKTQISLGIRPVWSESSLCAR